MAEQEPYQSIEGLECFKAFVALADDIWHRVFEWSPFAQATLGKQLVRAVDSIGANLVESEGRFSFTDELRFLVIARGSARETGYWIQRAAMRGFLSEVENQDWMERINRATRQLNGLISYRRRQRSDSGIRETHDSYFVNDPFPMPDAQCLMPSEGS